MSIKKITLMLPTLFLIACGGYQTQPANNVVNQLNDEGHLSDDDITILMPSPMRPNNKTLLF